MELRNAGDKINLLLIARKSRSGKMNGSEREGLNQLRFPDGDTSVHIASGTIPSEVPSTSRRKT